LATYGFARWKVKLIILFLDDNKDRTKKFRRAYPGCKTVKTADDMIALLSALTEPADYVFLDHDLGGEEYVDSGLPNTGMEVVRWVEENKPPVNRFIVHSMNPSARARMVVALDRAGYDVEGVPFSSLVL
jgi:ActR/RegA family two-component response regulator